MPATLIKSGKFVSHSGLILPDKIDCDALTPSDWHALALWFAEQFGAASIKFHEVIGIPTGGERLAEALRFHTTPRHSWQKQESHVLIVDDVLTTGRSMRECRDEYLAKGATVIGAVVFSRTPNYPRWIMPRWIENSTGFRT